VREREREREREIKMVLSGLVEWILTRRVERTKLELHLTLSYICPTCKKTLGSTLCNSSKITLKFCIKTDTDCFSSAIMCSLFLFVIK